MNQFIEYLKIHLISLDQEKEEIISMVGDDSIDWHFIEGQIVATQHLLSVATDMIDIFN